MVLNPLDETMPLKQHTDSSGLNLQGHDIDHNGIKPILAGAAAGLVATGAMTAATLVMFRLLPQTQRYPLPPAEITAEVKRQAGLGNGATRGQTLLAHFAYGAACGALFPVFVEQRKAETGALYGLAVWTASYLGWLPALKILKPATQHPLARNALMLLAHVVWGWTLGASERALVAKIGSSTKLER